MNDQRSEERVRNWYLALLGAVVLAACSETGPESPLATSREPTQASLGVTGSVTGSGHWEVFPAPVPPGFGLRRLTLHAVQLADGTVNGEWNIVVGATILHGTLDCVTFLPDGRSARVSGIVESVKFSNIFQAGTAFAMLVVDTGEGSAAPPDRTSDLLTFANQPPEVGRAYCEDGVEPAPVEPEDTLIGDFQVRADL